jgi:lysophospholipase L1-like esterase
LVAAAALWQLAVLVLYQDFLRPAGLLLLAPALLAVATVESGIKTFLGPHPFMGDCIFWYAEMAPESMRIRDFRGSLFRGQEVEPDKGDRFRILVVGGSVVFGASLPWGADYPTRLQPELDRTTSGKQVEVLNGGIPAFTSEMGLALLRERLLLLQPDLVISAWGVNDMAGNGTGPGLDRAFVERERWVAAHPWLKAARDATRQSGLYLWLRRSMLQKWIRVSDGTFEPTPGAGQRVTPDQFEENLRTLARLGRERGFRVAYTLDVHASELELPCDDPRSRNWGGEAGRIVRRVARDEGLTWLDARLAFCDPSVPTSELFFDGLHLSERGCSLLAKELASQLRAAGLLNDS